MSIDFSKITGLSDSKGVITQITDASGRVIWSAAPSVRSIILRPSADIVITHGKTGITFVPSSATEAYLLINEEICDGASTYVGVDSDSESTGNVTVTVALSGNTPTKVKKVTNLDIVVCATASAIENSAEPNPTGSVDVNVIVEGVSYNVGFGDNATWDAWGGQFSEQNYAPLYANKPDGNYYRQYQALFDAIQAYVDANCALPNIELYFHMMCDKGDDSGKSSYYARVSQAYVVIEYE